MGSSISNFTKDHMDFTHLMFPTSRLPRREWPSDKEDSPFDDNFGFEFKRRPKAMVATEEEMESGKLQLDKKDYCAHLLLEFRGCLKANVPFVLRCEHELHTYKQCEWEDQIIRMKEWEREKRLRQREYRKQQTLRKESLE